MGIDGEDRAAGLVADLRSVAASEAGAALVVRFQLGDDEEADRLVVPNQHQRDPVDYLKDLFRAGGRAIGLLVCTNDGRGHLKFEFRPAEGGEDVLPGLSEPFRYPALLYCRTCHRPTVHIVEENVRSDRACTHQLLVVATLGLWALVMWFFWKRWTQAACMVCATARFCRTRNVPAPA